MAFKAAMAEQISIEKQSWGQRLTRAWIGLFLFTVIINVLPYLPFWENESSEVAFVSQTVHTSAICSSSSWNNQEPQSSQDDFIVSASSIFSSPSYKQKVACRAVATLITSSRELDPVFWFFANQHFALNQFFSVYSERGPPRA